jgi:demethylmenaquinone methyltransferase/2-methoxy-6-polyprenyl-1,4-benzoquinol methylase
MSAKSEARAAYRWSARWYDPPLSRALRPIRRRIVSLAKRRKYGRILDVCCGTGEQLKLLAQAGIDGLGIDLSEAMLAVAAEGNPPARCVEADAADTGFGAESFDLLTTTFALHEKAPETAREIVVEMVRLTAEGGDLLIVDYDLGAHTSWRAKAAIWSIERFAGGEHYRNFRTYLRTGGLVALLEGLPLKERRRWYFAGGGVVMLLLEKSQAK